MIIYLMFMEIRLFFRIKSKYIYRFWSWIEFGLIICSWIGVVNYLQWYHEYVRITRLFKKTKGHVYIGLQMLNYLNDYLTFIYGFCCFFRTIKLVRRCRFTNHLRFFLQTVKFAIHQLFSFALMFVLILLSFTCLLYFLFQSKLDSASSFSQTLIMLLEITLMKFDAFQFSDGRTFLSSFCFSLFIYVVVFVRLSMFLSIINQSLRRARTTVPDDQLEIYSFTLNRFLCWISLKQQLAEERNIEDLQPLELFSRRIDELLVALDRVYNN